MILMQKISKNERCDFICIWINSLGNVFLKLLSLTGGLFSAFYFSVAAGLQNLNLYHAHDFCIILIFSRNIALELPYQPLSS